VAVAPDLARPACDIADVFVLIIVIYLVLMKQPPLLFAATESFPIFRRVDVDFPFGKWELCNLITI
jgi:hypothetical protein